MALLEVNQTNAGFGVEFFSRKIGMIWAHQHHKLTDQSASELMRTFWLKRAARLLEVQARKYQCFSLPSRL
ncbi:hypothetical protein I2I11_15050 [Pontibacter sp. 172403-2]|nr:hypothetical protein [Pontibacter sp. 172403-2]